MQTNMSAEETQQISLALYQYMCQYIVGSKKTVKTKRMLTTVQDNMLSDERSTCTITSGSFGEGLEMKGSDFDIMILMKSLTVCENKPDVELDPFQPYLFKINTDDTKLGFVKLQLRYSMNRFIINLCVETDGCLFLSNNLLKCKMGKLFDTDSSVFTEVNHGPCLSDRDGLFDLAFCLHSKTWISQADQWTKRSRGSWPSNEVISRITEHGVLFVPIGVKGSPTEEIEWRISFSVGEKFLIYSFHHTQLLCYALLKIVLKDIISTDTKCKDLLCSYYLKNILFWVSEETLLSEWKPHNLINCFMRCFKRLMYCVEYSLCPHYFIPEINMFENKIEGQNRRVLLHSLFTLHNFGWRCILFSPQLHNFFSVSLMSTEESFVDYFEQINSSMASKRTYPTVNYKIAVHRLLSDQSTSIKLYQYFYLLYSYQAMAKKIYLRQKDANKGLYGKYKTCESYLLQALHCDAVSGWLGVASFYYRIKQYRKVLAILVYSVSKCSREMIYRTFELSSTQRHLLSSKLLQTKGLIRVLQLLRLDNVSFCLNSTLIPRELELEILSGSYFIPPVVFAHFLSFLCHYHLNDIREYRNSLVNLQLTISEEYFVGSSAGLKSVGYEILGVALQIIGKNVSAKEAFQQAIALDPRSMCNYARRRLYMLDNV